MSITPDASALSVHRLSIAPHRLLFFVGASNLLLAMLWWTLWLGRTFLSPRVDGKAG